MSFRECSFLDKLWAVRHPDRSIAQIKRRHKEFLSELLAFYCCTCEHFLDAHEAQVTWFMDLIVAEVADLATNECFLLQPPYEPYVVKVRRSLYLHRIATRRGKPGKVAHWIPTGALAARAGLEIRQLMSDGTSCTLELSVLEEQITQLLEWTAGELIGALE